MYIYIYIMGAQEAEGQEERAAGDPRQILVGATVTVYTCGRVIYVYGRAAARTATYITCFAAGETFGDQIRACTKYATVMGIGWSP